MTATFDRLRDIIVRDFELAPERLMRETPLEEIELDSLAVTELVFVLEDEFRVTAESTDFGFRTLGDIADYLDRLLATHAVAAPPPVRKKTRKKTGKAAQLRGTGARKRRTARSTRDPDQAP